MILYVDYHGPQGNYAVVDGKIVPCDEEAARHIATNAHFVGLGLADSQWAQERSWRGQ